MKEFFQRKIAGVPIWIPIAIFVLAIGFYLMRRKKEPPAEEEQPIFENESMGSLGFGAPTGTTWPQDFTPSQDPFLDLPAAECDPTSSLPCERQQGGMPITVVPGFGVEPAIGAPTSDIEAGLAEPLGLPVSSQPVGSVRPMRPTAPRYTREMLLRMRRQWQSAITGRNPVEETAILNNLQGRVARGTLTPAQAMARARELSRPVRRGA